MHLLAIISALLLLLCELTNANTFPAKRKHKRACPNKSLSSDITGPSPPPAKVDYTGSDTVGSDPTGSDTVGADTAGNNGTSPSTDGLPSYHVSITGYGTGDIFNSPNCVAQNACGSPGNKPVLQGYTAAISEFLYEGPRVGAEGKACYTCWKIETGGKSIIVQIDNICPYESPLCGLHSTTETNDKGGNANFDLCKDSGAKQALLGDEDVAVGTATKQPDCSGWGKTT